MGEFFDVQDAEGEAEEALSLCDLVINTDGNNEDNLIDSRRTSSEPADFFEFFNHLNSEMSSAEDIIFCGKLVPFKDQQILSSQSPTEKTVEGDKNRNMIRKRSESLPETRSYGGYPTRFMRTSKSVDYRKPQRSPAPAREIERNSSTRSVDISAKKASNSKPRWFVLIFGMVKIPQEINLSDIKSRQLRRSPSKMFPPTDFAGVRKCPVNRSHRKGSWRLLSALSCKDQASVAVTATFEYLPQA